MSIDGLPSWVREIPLAHRGLHGDGVPENSLAAFDAAAAAGYGIELDARRTKDGEIAVVHDDDLSRLTGEPGSVNRMLLAEVTRRTIDGSDHRIPRLSEALAVIGGRVPVMIEVKKQARRDRGVEAILLDTLQHFPAAAHPRCIASFNPTVIRWFRAIVEDEIRVQTAGPIPVGRARAAAEFLVRRTFVSRFQEPSAVSVSVSSLDRAVVRDWIADGGAAWAWTVKNAEDLAATRAAGAVPIFEHVRP